MHTLPQANMFISRRFLLKDQKKLQGEDSKNAQLCPQAYSEMGQVSTWEPWKSKHLWSSGGIQGYPGPA